MLRSSLLILVLLGTFTPALAQDEGIPTEEAVPEEAIPSDEPVEEVVPEEPPLSEPEPESEIAPEEPEIVPEDMPPPADEPSEEGGIQFFDEGAPEEQMPADDYMYEEEPESSEPLPLRAAPMEPEEVIVRDPTTTTAATYGDRFRNKEEGKKVLFGEHRIRVSFARPDFDDGLKFYDKLYGDENDYPMIAADWFAYDWYVTLGLSLRAGYYTATGHTANDVSGANKTDLNENEVVKNDNGPTSLTLMPFQFAAIMEFTPFPSKYVVIDGWIGWERLYWQETRTVSDQTAAMFLLQATADEEPADEDSAPTNAGWTSATTVGVSANILLNPLDDRGARSLRSIGLGYIYLSPYMEIVRTLKDDAVSFGRSVFGVGFTFESVR